MEYEGFYGNGDLLVATHGNSSLGLWSGRHTNYNSITIKNIFGNIMILNRPLNSVIYAKSHFYSG